MTIILKFGFFVKARRRLMIGKLDFFEKIA
jgi:hypothetical protein